MLVKTGRLTTILMLALAMLLQTGLVMAQDTEPEDDIELDLFDEDEERTKQGWSRLYLAVGGTRLDADGKFAVILPDGNRYDIFNFDRAGLDETDSSYWLSINWRSANSRWGGWFGSWAYDVTGARTWQDEVHIPEKDRIPAGAKVTSEFEAKWYILEATYSFYRSDTIDTGIGFGLHTVDLDTSITARVQVGEEIGKVVSERLDTLAPLPNLLYYLYWKFTPRWSMVGRYGYFGLDYKDYSGQMTNAHLMINFDISPRWTLGAGYQFVDLDLKVDKTNYTQDYSIDFSGPMTFLRFAF